MFTAWIKVVRVGVVNCANVNNEILCHAHRITRFPTLKYFKPFSIKTDHGEDTDQVSNVTLLKRFLIDKLINTPETSAWPSLNAFDFTNVYDVWDIVPPTVKFALFYVEDTTSYSSEVAGVEFILDMSNVTEVYTTRVAYSSRPDVLQMVLPILPGIAVLTRVNNIIPLTEALDENTPSHRLDAVAKYLKFQKVNVPFLKDTESEFIYNETTQIIRDYEDTRAKVDVFFQIDLETALRFSLENDIPLKASNIAGQRRGALNAYIDILIKYFPFRDDKGRMFLNELKKCITKTLRPVQFQEAVRNLTKYYKPFTRSKSSYVGCVSRLPGLRGYPCSIWILFHFLTVTAESKPDLSTGPQEVLHALRGYVWHFYACTESAKNFHAETSDLEVSVKSLDDSILFLWKTHNFMNSRLHQYPGNLTEDPYHPKIQFPSMSHCPRCYSSAQDFNETVVLAYLKKVYSKISKRTDSYYYYTKVADNGASKEGEWTNIFAVIGAFWLYISIFLVMGVLLYCKNYRGGDRDIEAPGAVTVDVRDWDVHLPDILQDPYRDHD